MPQWYLSCHMGINIFLWQILRRNMWNVQILVIFFYIKILLTLIKYCANETMLLCNLISSYFHILLWKTVLLYQLHTRTSMTFSVRPSVCCVAASWSWFCPFCPASCSQWDYSETSSEASLILIYIPGFATLQWSLHLQQAQQWSFPKEHWLQEDILTCYYNT